MGMFLCTETDIAYKMLDGSVRMHVVISVETVGNDGILDAEELGTEHVKVTGDDGMVNYWCPAPFEVYGNVIDGYQIQTYNHFWYEQYKDNIGDPNKVQPFDGHDIDKYWESRGYAADYFPKLDPTNADTDGDGVDDGDEIKDDYGRWPDHVDYCKAEDGSGDPDYSQVTNPLDSRYF